MPRALRTFICQCAFASREDFVFEQCEVLRGSEAPAALPLQGLLGLGRGWRGIGDQLFFLLSVERKQSGKWRVRTVSRRACPAARPASGSLAPSLGAASSAGQAAGPVSTLDGIPRDTAQRWEEDWVGRWGGSSGSVGPLSHTLPAHIASAP